eukprot:CAMPEP_0171071386 /NCGR_PEP_ID=MMETSP0766_2-20121228/10296_1 /TAXON_ID=439317 /ORGANISM="Gambierdiscus australes, Strain CAWD 149" /LENGTH=360 /DNA_ID=CAMNT_0011527925 /DNA_START=68 /DNA_END=1150 /DNA_ORIENTATION=-
MGACSGKDPRLNEGQLVRVHAVESRILGRMQGVRHKSMNVVVKLDAKLRCHSCTKCGACCGNHPEFVDFPVRTTTAGPETSDRLPLVLVHSFMMGAACFYRWLPNLAQKRRVYAIDIMGMAGSGRPGYSGDRISASTAEALLVDPFVQWAEAMGLTEFAVLGHGFGGFVCSAWASRSASQINWLGLLSPVLGFSDERIVHMQPEDPPWQELAASSVADWQGLIPPDLIQQIPGARATFHRVATSPQAGLSPLEAQLLAQYIVANISLPGPDGEAVVHFDPVCRPMEMPGTVVKARLANIHCPVFIAYGEHDWMPKATQEEIPKAKFVTVPGSGHHPHLENPLGLTNLVLAETPTGRKGAK